MNEIKKINDIEMEKLKNLFNENLPKFIFALIGIFAFAYGVYYVCANVPMEFLARRNRYGDVKGLAIESLGFWPIVISIIIISFWLVLVANNHLKFIGLIKDLKNKEKIVAELKVDWIKSFSASYIRESAELGNKVTHMIYFKKNEFKIKDYPFNGLIEPKLINAKKVYIERAKYSKVDFIRRASE